MAKPNNLAAVALLLLVAAVLLLRSTDTGPVDTGSRLRTPWKGLVAALPFSPEDVLPLLPRRVAMAALRALRGASDIFPVFVGAATAGWAPGASPPDGGRVEWKGACFYENEAWLVFHNDSGSKYGGGTLHIKIYTPWNILQCLQEKIRPV